MNFSKEIESLNNEYLRMVKDRNDNNESFISYDDQDNQDLNIIISFMEELFGNRLNLTYGLGSKLDFFPRLDDDFVKKYIDIISKDGLKKAAEDWQNTDYHKNVVNAYKQNINDGESHNSILKMVSIIRNRSLFPGGVATEHIDEAMYEFESKEALLKEAIFYDNSLMNEIEEKGLDKVFHEKESYNKSLKDKPNAGLSDDELPF